MESSSVTGEFTYSRVYSLYRPPLLTEVRLSEVVSVQTKFRSALQALLYKLNRGFPHSGRTRPTTPLPVDFVLSPYFRATSEQKLFSRLETRAALANKFPFTVN